MPARSRAAKSARELHIAHVAQIEISRGSGMGRVAWHWRAELERRGHAFTHIGRKPLGREVHPAIYPIEAMRAVSRLSPRADLVLVHEPAAAPFLMADAPLIVFSHGIERRGWSIELQRSRHDGEALSIRSRLLYPLWRLIPCDIGLARAEGALVINREDYDFALARYGRRPDATFQFRNGVNGDSVVPEELSPGAMPTILFLGSWIHRKGTRTLVEAAGLLQRRGLRARWLVAGSGVPAAEVLADWPEGLRGDVEVVPAFEPSAEPALLGRAAVFVLPSFFEGQPLALLQAMASSLPVVASGTCGQRDLIVHGQNGLLFPPGDSSALADGIAECLHSENLRDRLGRAAKASVSDRTWESVSSEVADFVERIYAGAKGRLPQC